MQSLPFDVDLNSLPGPKRSDMPAMFLRDEIVYSPSGKNFALAYSIAEVSMGNEIGCILWGKVQGGKTVVVGNPAEIHSTCWFRPWANWVDDETFVFKAQQYDGKRLHLPLVVVRFGEGFSVLPGTSIGESRPNEVTVAPSNFKAANTSAMLRAINADV